MPHVSRRPTHLFRTRRNGPGKGKKYWYAVPEGEEQRKGKTLPPKEKRLFDTKTIVCGKLIPSAFGDGTVY